MRYSSTADLYGQQQTDSSSIATSCPEAIISRKIKCVFVGDAAIGKTSLIVSYTTNGYPQEYVPTAFDNYSVQVRVDDQPVLMQICDTAGQNEFDSLRALCYPNTDVFVICFSVVSPASFRNVETRWLDEIGHVTSNSKVPCLLVGTQSDLRTNIKVMLELNRHQEAPVSDLEALKLAQRINALQYIECSALTQLNLKEVFDSAILAVLGCPVSNKPLNKPKVTLQRFCGRKSFRKLKEKLKRSNSTVESSTIVPNNNNNNNIKSGSKNNNNNNNNNNSNNNNVANKRQHYSYNNERLMQSMTQTTFLNAVSLEGVNSKTNVAAIESSMSSSSPPPPPPPPQASDYSNRSNKTTNKLKRGWRRLLCIS